MCGIGGTAGFAELGLLLEMNRVQHHRGPDDSGTWISPAQTVGLAACRLSIIDLSPAGHMPMANETHDVHVAFNGEIYNFPELRAELETRGHVFRSRTDTEVIVHGFEEWGTDIFRRLNGMFAIAISDTRARSSGSGPEVILARDRFGIKPLYFRAADGRLLFASEVKALLAAPGVARSPNLATIPAFLRFLWVPGPQTMFAGIEKLAPGSFLRWSDGRYSIAAYWDLTFDPEAARSGEEWVEELRAVLDRSVRRSLISDVPLGIFLSGGLDSTTIAAFAKRAGAGPLDAYTVGLRERDAKLEQSPEDLMFARLVANRFGLRLHEVVLDPDLAQALRDIVYHLDEPVGDPAALATQCICAAATGHVKVLLSGQGADEVFAGYRTYWVATTSRFLSAVPSPLLGAGPPLAHAIGLVGKSLGNAGKALAAERYLIRLFDGARMPPGQRFVRQHAHLTDSEIGELLSFELIEQIGMPDPDAAHLRYFEAHPDDDYLNRMMYVDCKTFLPEQNLTYSDKLSSASSIEVRVPFLDNEVAELMARVPPRFKMKGFDTKRLLKRAVSGIVPDEVVKRPKAGFGAPIRSWLRSDLATMVDDLLSADRVAARGLFKPAAVRRLVEDQRSGAVDRPFSVWALLSLELWMQRFMDPGVPSGWSLK
jgi:asparagine synthase (glutamine-hydrolysing)